MITLKLKAGLGNQLFQYAYARALALRSKTDLTIDLNWFSNIAPGDTKRVFLLDKYNLPLANQSVRIVDRPNPSKLVHLCRKIKNKIKREIFGYSDHTYYPQLAKPVGANKNVEVEGFWNTEKYFKDYAGTIRKELTLKEKLGVTASQTEEKLLELGKSHHLVLLHVRRGDYVSNTGASKHHGLSGLEYYEEAIKYILENPAVKNPLFVLASEDMDWVQENIIPLLNNAPYEVLTHLALIQDYEELYLMSLCHHFIIANSSFSWWGAWLSKSGASAEQNSDSAQPERQDRINKIIIGPKRWVANPNVDTCDVMPEDWIRL